MTSTASRSAICRALRAVLSEATTVRRAYSSGTPTGQATLANKPKRGKKRGDIDRGSKASPKVSTSPLVDPTPASTANRRSANALTLSVLAGAAGAMYYSVTGGFASSTLYPPPSTNEEIVNWSGTHHCQPKRLYQPETHEQVEAIVEEAARTKTKLRCIGSGLSPNGIAFDSDGMISLSLMDKILSIDAEGMTVTVQSGARVQDVADKIREKGLTLLNYASIREQTIGGFTQIGAHGTGAGIPSVDDSVVRLKLVTPALGTIVLSRDSNPKLFELAKVGLGCLGVVTEVTLRCVPAHKLVEKTFVTSVKEVKRNHVDWIQQHKHLRYMWLPATDSVVVVQCNEEGSAMATAAVREDEKNRMSNKGATGSDSSNPLRDMLKSKNNIDLKGQNPDDMSPTECRDVLLAHDPLNATWVASINRAEAAFWKSNEGIRIGYSDEILGFDCGGQQWVFEVAFPCGTRAKPNTRDISYMEELLKLIKRNNIPAPSPIEQRWTSGSSSSMSPCAGPADSLHSWVGIIMYLPEDPDKEALRDDVTHAFIHKYKRMVEQQLLSKYDAAEHWAKIEVPEDPKDLQATRARLHKRYPVEAFQKARGELDPDNILGGTVIDAFFTG
jgi:L-galactono-1,4-lactone dehydrogenase